MSAAWRLTHNGSVDVELQVVPNCPGADPASELLRAALDDLGLAHVGFATRLITSGDVARALRFAGSPAFVVDGTDLFDTDATPGALACRLYVTPDGPRNAPTFDALRDALWRRLATT